MCVFGGCYDSLYIGQTAGCSGRKCDRCIESNGQECRLHRDVRVKERLSGGVDNTVTGDTVGNKGILICFYPAFLSPEKTTLKDEHGRADLFRNGCHQKHQLITICCGFHADGHITPVYGHFGIGIIKGVYARERNFRRCIRIVIRETADEGFFQIVSAAELFECDI